MVRVRWSVAILLLLVAASTFAATRPPRDLHFVRDHWTPYNPPDPATFPPGSTVHIIVRGDTLWDLAAKYYGNAYLWPQLWEANTYITDAHWIYPGDPLLIQGEGVTGEVTTGTGITTTTTTTGVGVGEGMEETGLAAELRPVSPPIPLAAEADVFCWGYLGHPQEPMPNRIRSFEDTEMKYEPGAVLQEMGVGEGDVVYISGGMRTGLQPGETYLIIKPAELVHHPKNGRLVGRHYDYRGQLRILCVTDDDATALITQSCKDIHIGDRLKPMPQLPIPFARLSEMAGVCTPPSGRAEGFIVNAKDYRFVLGEGAVVEVNLGREDLVEPGTFLTVFRESPQTGNPRQNLGEIAVLTAEGRTATGKVVQMRYGMRVGDRVEIK
jgi:hypothetical protein